MKEMAEKKDEIEEWKPDYEREENSLATTEGFLLFSFSPSPSLSPSFPFLLSFYPVSPINSFVF